MIRSNVNCTNFKSFKPSSKARKKRRKPLLEKHRKELKSCRSERKSTEKQWLTAVVVVKAMGWATWTDCVGTVALTVGAYFLPIWSWTTHVEVNDAKLSEVAGGRSLCFGSMVVDARVNGRVVDDGTAAEIVEKWDKEMRFGFGEINLVLVALGFLAVGLACAGSVLYCFQPRSAVLLSIYVSLFIVSTTIAILFLFSSTSQAFKNLTPEQDAVYESTALYFTEFFTKDGVTVSRSITWIFWGYSLGIMVILLSLRLSFQMYFVVRAKKLEKKRKRLAKPVPPSRPNSADEIGRENNNTMEHQQQQQQQLQNRSLETPVLVSPGNQARSPQERVATRQSPNQTVGPYFTSEQLNALLYRPQYINKHRPQREKPTSSLANQAPGTTPKPATPLYDMSPPPPPTTAPPPLPPPLPTNVGGGIPLYPPPKPDHMRSNSVPVRPIPAGPYPGVSERLEEIEIPAHKPRTGGHQGSSMNNSNGQINLESTSTGSAGIVQAIPIGVPLSES